MASSMNPKSPSSIIIGGHNRSRQNENTTPDTPRSRTSQTTDKSAPTATLLMEPMELGALLNRDDHDQFRFGWGSFSPDVLQDCFLNPKTLLIILCLATFLIGFGVNGVFEAATTHIQRRFAFNSNEMTLILIAYYVGELIVIFPVAYFGSHSAHKPRWLAVGCVLVAIGCFISVSPHAFLDVNFHPEQPHCHGNETHDHAAQTNGSSGTGHKDCVGGTCHKDMRNKLKYVFGVGHFVYGLGAAIPPTMGIVLMDEHVSYRASPVYTGVYRTFDRMGPILGYIATAAALQTPGNIEKGDDSPLEEEYGAWWIPALGCGFGSLLVAFILFGFPPELAGENRAHTRDLMEEMMDAWRVPKFAKKWWVIDVGDDVCAMIKRAGSLILQPGFAILLAEAALTKFIVAGFSSIISEHIEKVFKQSSENAAYLAGGIVFGMSTIGLLSGTLIQYGLRLGVRGNLRLALITALGFLVCSFGFLVSCNEGKFPNFVGVKTYVEQNKVGQWIETRLKSNCSTAHCDCDHTSFHPVCYEPSSGIPIEFFSACHAGCEHFAPDMTAGYECTCVQHYVGEVIDSSASVSQCQPRCTNKLISFLIALAWCSLFIAMRRNSMEQVVLRFVPFKYRLLALCIVMVVSRLFGALPAVKVFDILIDKACRSKAEWTGRCVFFDVTEMTKFLTITSSAAATLIVLICIFAIIVHTESGAVRASKKPKGEEDLKGSKESKEMKTPDSKH